MAGRIHAKRGFPSPIPKGTTDDVQIIPDTVAEMFSLLTLRRSASCRHPGGQRGGQHSGPGPGDDQLTGDEWQMTGGQGQPPLRSAHPDRQAVAEHQPEASAGERPETG